MNTLVQKLSELTEKGEKNTIIDVDLMLDYTRVIYADLLEYRSRLLFTSNLPEPASSEPEVEPQVSHAVKIDDSVAVYESLSEEALPNSSDAAIEKTGDALAESTGHTSVTVTTEEDIRHRIGINDKYQFISELFGNDKEAYEKTLDALNSFDNHHEAVQWLHHNVFDQNNWSDENESVQLFYEMLRSFFEDK